jgi:hypothetical protein
VDFRNGTTTSEPITGTYDLESGIMTLSCNSYYKGAKSFRFTSETEMFEVEEGLTGAGFNKYHRE